MENQSGKGKNLIIVLLVVIVVLLGMILYLVVNNKTNVPVNNQNNTPTEVTPAPEPEPELTPEPEPTVEQEPTTEPETTYTKISNEDRTKIFNSLLTPSKEYGLYFGKSVTINNVDSNDFLEYVLENYVVDKKISMKSQIDCLIGNGPCQDGEIEKFGSATKTDVDEYIKNKFNTDRVFSPSKVYNSEPKYRTGTINGYSTGIYVYDNEAEVYYFGYMAKSGSSNKLSHKYVKTEEDNDNVYIYTLLNNKKNYKHTFKKVDGNYYWTGSEIVK